MQPALTQHQQRALAEITGCAAPPSGNRVELRRYRITAGCRALLAQCVKDRVAVVDIPVDHADRVYLIDPDVTSRDELAGLLDAYIGHSVQADQPAIAAQRASLAAELRESA